MPGNHKYRVEQLGARTAGSGGIVFRLRTYIQRHLYALFASLGQIWRSPFSTLLTTLTMAVTLALPAGLVLMVKSADDLTAHWQGAPQASLYLKPGSSQRAIDELLVQLEEQKAVNVASQIPPEEGMQSLAKSLEMQGMMALLGENPLPHVIVVEVAPTHHSPEKLEPLLAELGELPAVDVVQLDLEWLKKLDAMLAAVERGVWVIAAFLGVAVLLTIGNSIRLSIRNKWEEIEVMKLVGAKDAFIRRPFLYGGFWLGLLSGALALVLLYMAYWLLSAPIAQIMTLYEASIDVSILLILQVSAGMLLAAVVLGWLGAWMAVTRQLRRIEPV